MIFDLLYPVSLMQKEEPKSDTTIVQVDSIMGKSEKLNYDFSERFKHDLH